MDASKFLSFSPFRKETQAMPEDSLLEDIRQVCRQMDAAYTRFELEHDEDLVEAAIYELEALKARYRYLIKQAKQKKLESPSLNTIVQIPVEKEWL